MAAPNTNGPGLGDNAAPLRDEPERGPRRSFDLRDKRLFDQLDEVERKALTGYAISSPQPNWDLKAPKPTSYPGHVPRSDGCMANGDWRSLVMGAVIFVVVEPAALWSAVMVSSLQMLQW
jgi:hypothetical protein